MYTDTARPERYHALAPMYYRNAQAVIVGFDVTKRCTFEGCDSWIQKLRTNVPDCVVVAVGNKIDLVDSREVSTKEARAHFETMNPPVPFFETSAKTGEGVNELFDSVTRMIIGTMRTKKFQMFQMFQMLMRIRNHKTGDVSFAEHACTRGMRWF